MKYINAATAAEKISDKLNIPLNDLCDIVAEITSEDVQPVKHGRWTWDSNAPHREYGAYKCSNCGCHSDFEENYCSYCGCKQDLDGDIE